ncbi:MAG TPA: hypothetical protein VLB69_02225 [Rudaea sp.]|nr:hypothetical protein [Rudaea sp.]
MSDFIGPVSAFFESAPDFFDSALSVAFSLDVESWARSVVVLSASVKDSAASSGNKRKLLDTMASPDSRVARAYGSTACFAHAGRHACPRQWPLGRARVQATRKFATGQAGAGPRTRPDGRPDGGLPIPFVYHDHILSGAPGLGNDGTAGEFMGRWKIIVLMYNPSVLSDPNFKPVTSEVDLDAAEAAGEFLPINPGSVNEFELITGGVLICPLVAPEA